MDITLWLELGLFVVLLGLSAFFSSSETSLFSLNRLQLEQMRREGHPRLKLVEQLLSAPRRLIVTILIGNELVNITASVISAAIVIDIVGAKYSWLNVFIMVPLLLLFGEITPKTLAIHHNVAFATYQSRYIELFARLITPLRNVVRIVADYFITLVVGEERSRVNIITEDMVRSLTQAAVGEGALDGQEAKYIKHIFELGDKAVRDVMTVRSQIFSIADSMPLDEIIAELHRVRFTKIPVYESDKDAVIGILFARDLLAVDLAKRAPHRDRETLRGLLRKPYFVPESKKATELFVTFRQRKLSVALTADEFGGVTGLITMEDLLESIFGAIPSRSERANRQLDDIEVLGPDRYRVLGVMSVHSFAERINVEIEQTDATTIGGLLLHEFGEVPSEGDTVELAGCQFTVSSMEEQRIREILVEVTRHSVPDEPDSLENSAMPEADPPPSKD